MVYSQSYLKMPDGRLNEIENKRVTQISGLKSGRGREKFTSDRLWEIF